MNCPTCGKEGFTPSFDLYGEEPKHAPRNHPVPEGYEIRYHDCSPMGRMVCDWAGARCYGHLCQKSLDAPAPPS